MWPIRRQLGGCLLLALLAGCGHSSEPRYPPYYPPPSFGAEDSLFTDQQLRAAFFSSYVAPPGFYAEPRQGSAPYYVNTWSIHSLYDRSFRTRLELSTEDLPQARLWADSTVANSSRSARLDSSEAIITQRYFEFLSIGNPPEGNLALRVHRLSYLDRSTEGPRGLDWGLGAFQIRPVDNVATRGVVEYLWFLEARHSSANKPLSSFSGGHPGMHVIFWVGSGPSGVGPETIQLWRDEYRIAVDTGDIVRHREWERSLEAVPR